MLRLRSINKMDFDNYIQKQKNISHFMQTSSWGEFDKVTNHTTPYYLGLVNEKEEIIAATLLLEEHLPMNTCCLYSPRGFAIDYKDTKILSIFTKRSCILSKHSGSYLYKRTQFSSSVVPSYFLKVYPSSEITIFCV